MIGWLEKFRSLQFWDKNIDLSKRLTGVLTLAVLLSGTATFVALTRIGPLGEQNSKSIFGLLFLDLFLLFPLGVLIALKITRVWNERRQGVAGAKLHVRLVQLFSVIAITPAILVALFSAFLMNFGVEQWFNKRVSSALNESLVVANAYLSEHRQTIGKDAVSMRTEILSGDRELLNSPFFLRQMLNALAETRGLSDVIIFDSNHRVIAKSGLGISVDSSINAIPALAYDRAIKGDVQVLTPEGDERVWALTLLDTGDNKKFLYIGRFADPKVLGHVQRTSSAVAEYKRLEHLRSSLEITFSVLYGAVSLLLLMGAILVGLSFATKLVAPIIALIHAAEQVREGDLTARVTEFSGADELGSLSRSFNRMTEQLDMQRQSLIQANTELDERRRFTESVLEGVPAGVIGLDSKGYIEIANSSAFETMGLSPEKMVGLPIGLLLPEIDREIHSIILGQEQVIQTEICHSGTENNKTLLVRIVVEKIENIVVGFVVTLDDISELMSAQRKAAWADVARRIAHEIKNPLTPIQLATERLKRKYLKLISEDEQKTFLVCTDTIIRQVGDIGKMVDEFSSFARMPTPMMKKENILEIISQAIFLAKNGYPDVTFATEIVDEPTLIYCDSRQIGQALTNLLKNAVESIQSKGNDEEKGLVAIELKKTESEIVVVVSDNGKGLPFEIRDRLTEPYVTTHSKGTGLGLAIVKKIMEDHGGSLSLKDGPLGGAMISLIFNRIDNDSKLRQQVRGFNLNGV
jgi:two-component system nitrogen regulation sensor histidine kinase NtrY